MAQPRSAKQVIDQLIRENRPWEWLCFISAASFVVIGLAVIIRAMIVPQSEVLTVIGGVTSGLFWPAIAHARRIRKENQAIRLMEIPLSKAETDKEAAEILREAFVEVFVNMKG
jgi:hypothetical protein